MVAGAAVVEEGLEILRPCRVWPNLLAPRGMPVPRVPRLLPGGVSQLALHCDTRLLPGGVGLKTLHCYGRPLPGGDGREGGEAAALLPLMLLQLLRAAALSAPAGGS